MLLLATALTILLVVSPTCAQVESEQKEKKAAETTVSENLEVRAADPLGIPPMTRTAPGMANLFGDAYWYLPYAVTNTDQGVAFAKAYADVLQKGQVPPESLKVAPGKGAGGGDTIPKLREGVTQRFIKDIDNPAASAVSQSDIPVIIAQPKPAEGGANVLFMDGHVEFVKYDEFPVTEKFINVLKELDPPEYSEEDKE